MKKAIFFIILFSFSSITKAHEPNVFDNEDLDSPRQEFHSIDSPSSPHSPLPLLLSSPRSPVAIPSPHSPHQQFRSLFGEMLILRDLERQNNGNGG